MISIKCDDCGKFTCPPYSFALIYDFYAMELFHQHTRCIRCTEKFGPVHSNAKPSNGDMRPYQGYMPSAALGKTWSDK